jgi:hypothetical protein
VNRLSEQQSTTGTLVPVDPERHALEARIEHAKNRIVEDLNRASGLVRDAAARAGRGLGRLAVYAGVVVAGVIALAIARRTRRRIRITWR